MFSILHDIEIKSDVEKVFSCLSKPEHLNNWWTKKSSGHAEMGHIYRLYFTPEYDWRAQLCSINKYEHLEFKMTKSDEDWTPTTFGFKLSPTAQGTMLSFYHNNWKNQNHHFRRTSYCWAILLKGLKDYCENDIIVPFKERV